MTERIVTLDFELMAEPPFCPDDLMDRSGRITFVTDWGNYLPGLHELLKGKEKGDFVKNISIDAGWGAHRPELIFDVDRKRLEGLIIEKKTDIITNRTVHLKKKKTPVWIVKASSDSVRLDANPPLAGASYICSFSVVETAPLPCLNYNQELFLVSDKDHRYQVSTLALGCFWGAELFLTRIEGVVGTQVGYTQGTLPNPTYQQICQGTTKHREAVRVVFDSTKLSYRELLLKAMKRLHDVTSSESLTYGIFDEGEEQDDGNDQYKRGVYFHSSQQEEIAREVLAENQNRYRVELRRANTFFLAEDYHQQYLYKGGQSTRKGSKDPIRCFG